MEVKILAILYIALAITFIFQVKWIFEDIGQLRQEVTRIDKLLTKVLMALIDKSTDESEGK